MRIAVDTNVLVRYLTWDDEGQAIEAARAIKGADAIVVPTIVRCELAWVLKRAYRYAGPEIIDILRRFVAIRAVEIDRPAAEAGIAMLARGGDFADGVVRHEADRAKYARLVTFDQGFARLLGRDKVVPASSVHVVTRASVASLCASSGGAVLHDDPCRYGG